MTNQLETLRRWSLLVTGTLLLAACGGSGSSGGGATGPQDFNGVVRSTLQQAESSAPVEVEDIDFVFTDQPDAFDDITQ